MLSSVPTCDVMLDHDSGVTQRSLGRMSGFDMLWAAVGHTHDN